MTEKSGMEMLEELLEKVTLLDRRYTVIEQMMKELLSRANGFPLPNNKTDIKPETKPTLKPPQATQAPQPTGKTYKAVGKIQDKNGRMRSGVNITVYNDKNQVIKQTKTNKAGEWMAFLPSGRYSAECYLKDEIHANITFAVQPGTITRVGQPEV